MSHSLEPQSVVIVGRSRTEVCGVRDYAATLATELTHRGYHVGIAWSERSAGHRRLGSIRRPPSLHSPVDVVIVNYSVFAESWHGIPLRVPRLAMSLARTSSRVVLIGHELAYPWGRRGLRGSVLALIQRLALLPLAAASDCVVVTTPQRLDWLQRRRWLPSRPTLWAPVFSNIPVAESATIAQSNTPRIGVFGYGQEADHRDLVAQALSRVGAALVDCEVVLLGGPGPHSAHGRAWQAALDAAGCPARFTGLLAADELSRALSRLTVLVAYSGEGPSPRKGTLAAALAHGVPIVAVDGPQRWESLIDAGAIALAPPEAHALAGAIVAVVANTAEQERLARASRAFYERSMSVSIVTDELERAMSLAQES